MQLPVAAARRTYATAAVLAAALIALESDRRGCVATDYTCDSAVTSLVLAAAIATAFAAGIFFDARHEYGQLAGIAAAVFAAAAIIAAVSALALPLGGDSAGNALVTLLEYAAFLTFALATGSIARSIYAYLREY